MPLPILESRRVRLRPAGADDGVVLYRILLRLGLSTLPTQEAFLSEFAGHAAAQFRIERRDTGEVVGFSSLHELDPAGHVDLGVYTDPAKILPGLGAEAGILTINYAFATWNIHKVYIRTTRASIPSMGLSINLLAEEGVLRDHLYFQGTLWDLHIFAMYREKWMEFDAERTIRHLAPSAS
ncbi:GNAT family N-acetyltransferase [Sphaerisporangium dianthi]|uniref:GNAT family N-acetyltransferase n=1 Tax=Sphaerisporangium dianthi TaxID=1436120 RepID=A0ABV9CQ39_9ACTN